jgi:regulator of sigma E protease
MDAARDSARLRGIFSKFRAEPLEVFGERPAVDGKRSRPPTQVRAQIPVAHFVDFGFRLGIEPVRAIRPESPASKAGFRIGDRIVAVDGKTDFDPMRLPDYCYDHAGQVVAFKVVRVSSGKEESVTLSATPQANAIWAEPIAETEPFEVPGLGLACGISPRIVSVHDGSPAAKAGIKAGDTLGVVTIRGPRIGNKSPKETPVPIDGKKGTWPLAFEIIQQSPMGAVKFSLAGSERAFEMTPAIDESWPRPDRGLRFQMLAFPLPPLGVVESMRRGAEDTLDTVVSVYMMLRGLITGDISVKAVAGPIGIASIASQVAKTGIIEFVRFLALLSVSLAVTNFLPIPPLDGGQMIFLLAEKVRGRPLPEKAVAAGLYAGLALVLGLMLFVLVQDVIRLLR